MGIRAPKKQTSITKPIATQIGISPKASEPNQLATEKYCPKVGFKMHKIVITTIIISNKRRNMSIFLNEYLKSFI